MPLASLYDAGIVLAQAAQTLGAKAKLEAHIGDKRLLLLFDNFEQLVEAGPDVAGLVSACPNMKAIVTSREPLHVTGEQEYPVPPLVEQEAVELFHARARAAVPSFTSNGVVADICRRLDNLPLAIELAAARVTALSPDQILERLEKRLPLLTRGPYDVPKRQRTLRATIEWSYDLLSEDEKALFRRLSVFAGGCTLEAAEEVADADLDTLQSLVEKSLVRYSNERYWMLETIREYAHECLVAADDHENSRRFHFEYFRTLAEHTEPRLGDPDQAVVLDQLEREHGNFRAALNWALSASPDRALELAVLLTRFWRNRDRELDDTAGFRRQWRSHRRRLLHFRRGHFFSRASSR